MVQKNIDFFLTKKNIKKWKSTKMGNRDGGRESMEYGVWSMEYGVLHEINISNKIILTSV